MRYLMLLLSLSAIALAAVGPAGAGVCTISGPGTFALQVCSSAPLMKTEAGAAVSGTIVLSPVEELAAGAASTFYLDDQVKAISALSRPELILDTTKLADGLHELRVDVSDGTRLAFSTGALPLHVVNNTTLNLLGQTKPEEAAGFVKLYRKIILREIVWFNNREADLEKHAFMNGGRVYITLTDLLRHVGGTLIWGPSRSYVLAERNGTKLRFVPGTATVYVNGKRASLGRATSRSDNRLFVPIRPVLRLLGVNTDWNRSNSRAYVNTK